MFTHQKPHDWLLRLAFLTALIPLLLATVIIPMQAQTGPVNASNVTRIYDIQYTTHPSGNSPYRYQYVTVRGVVTATNFKGFVVAEEEGPWHAIYVYTQTYGPSIGDWIQFTGRVMEYQGLTELTNVSDYQLLGVKKFDHIKAWPIPVQEAAQEAYESVLVKFHQVSVTGFTYYDEWTLADNTGSINCAYMNDYNYFPTQGDTHLSVSGIIYYQYGEFMLMPRRTNDMEGPKIPHYALRGDIVTMNATRDIIRDGYVEILGDQIVGVTAVRPNQCDLVYAVEGYIFPGLIDAHNHPFWNVFDHIPFPAAEIPYDNRYEWQASQTYLDFKTQYGNFMGYPSPVVPPSVNVEKLSEFRALCAGTTTIQGSNCNETFSEDYALQGVGINNAERFPARSYHIVNPLSYSPAEIGYIFSQFWDRFLIHLCEGTDASSLTEFYAIKNAGLLCDRITIIHGIPLGATEFGHMAAANAHLVWSPKSNDVLYHQTANIPAALAAGVNVALAPDWTLSGEFNILDELRFAEGWSASHWSSSITAQQFAEFVTVNAADALGIAHRIGSIEAGKQADLMVIPVITPNPYDDLLDTREQDVKLTVVGGRPMYGDPALMQSFPFVSNVETVSICGASKKVSWAVDSKFAWYSDQPVSLMLQEAIDAYNYASPKIVDFLHYDQCTTIPKRGAPADADLPMQLTLHQNYPNPFNPVTTIAFSLPVDGDVSIVVFDALGREVARLVDEHRSVGSYTVPFDGRYLPSGTYLCSMTAAGTRLTRWMTLAK